MNTARRLVALGAISGFVAVVMGAFGAHGLRQIQPPIPEQRLLAFDTGVRYQMYHALALIAAAWVATQLSETWARRAGHWFVIGTVLFSWSLYALVLFDRKWLGMITPFGGLAFLVGWAFLAVAAVTSSHPAP